MNNHFKTLFLKKILYQSMIFSNRVIHSETPPTTDLMICLQNLGVALTPSTEAEGVAGRW